MGDWQHELFVEKADLFLRVMDARWPRAEKLVEGMLGVLSGYGIHSGELLDLCCGNGRICVHMAKRGFRATGIDISDRFLEDAGEKAREHGVSHLTRFVQGDVREFKRVLGHISQPFDVVTSVWTSVGYSIREGDVSIFSQARELARKGAVLVVADTAHSARWPVVRTSYSDLGDMVMLEEAKQDQFRFTVQTTWSFYSKDGQNLKFVDKVGFEIHVYGLSEFSSLLSEAGWEPVVAYGDLSTLQPLTPLTGLNLVSVAK